MNTCEIVSCGAETSAALCRRCVDQVVRDCRGVPALLADLEITITGQRGHTLTGTRTPGDPHALPVNLGASDRLTALRVSLVAAATQLAVSCGPRTPWCADCEQAIDVGPHPAACRRSTWTAVLDAGAIPVGSPGDYALWIARRPSWLASARGIGEHVERLTLAIIRARRATDIPPERVYAGMCDECESDMYHRTGAPHVTCAHCGLRYDAEERRDWLLDAVRGQLADSPTITRGLAKLVGREITAAMLRGYVHRGKLARFLPDPRDPHARPRYRVGDVIDLVTNAANERNAATTRVP